MKKDILLYTLLAIIFLSGLIGHGFIGGALCGATSVFATAYLFGRRQAKRAIDLVDQRLKNLMINNMNTD